jgi:hypothetical protein
MTKHILKQGGPTSKKKQGVSSSTMDEWKRTILSLPQNRGWTMEELDSWLESGGKFHALENTVSFPDKMKQLEKAFKKGILKTSPGRSVVC